jgi:hypothetical protein
MTIKNTYVSISFELLKNILSAGFSITTTRLLIGMIYIQDRADLWRSDDRYMSQPAEAETWEFGAELRKLVGPTKVNSAAPLIALIADVQGSGLFDEIFMTHGNRRIRWRFSPVVHEKMALRWLGEAFALLDIHHVAACRTVSTLDLYCRSRNLRNHRIPEFIVPLERRWCDCRRDLFLALKQVAGMVGTTFFVGLEWERRGEGVQRLRIRLRHEGTTWYPDKLRYWALNARVFRVSESDEIEIDGQDLRDYAIWNEDPAQVEANLRKNLRQLQK